MTVVIVDWHPPAPRPGLAGALDRFIGPGATRAEIVLQFAIPAIAAILALLHARYIGVHWSAIQYVLCALLAFDIAGGIITNATSSAKRWYHRAGQGFRQHFRTVLLHLAHPALVAWLFLAFDVPWFLAAAGYLLLASVVVLRVPPYVQRPIAMIAFAVGLLIAMYGLHQPAGLAWFLPLFYLKLLVSHLVKEEPYRPDVARRLRERTGKTWHIPLRSFPRGRESAAVLDALILMTRDRFGHESDPCLDASSRDRPSSASSASSSTVFAHREHKHGVTT